MHFGTGANMAFTYLKSVGFSIHRSCLHILSVSSGQDAEFKGGAVALWC